MKKLKQGEDADLFNQIRKFKLKAYFDNNCKVKHNDRKDFLSFLIITLDGVSISITIYLNLRKKNKNFLFLIFFHLFILF